MKTTTKNSTNQLSPHQLPHLLGQPFNEEINCTPILTNFRELTFIPTYKLSKPTCTSMREQCPQLQAVPRHPKGCGNVMVVRSSCPNHSDIQQVGRPIHFPICGK
ncbi:hypothetical protein CR513_61900, partial [Mucuna pruriens]